MTRRSDQPPSRTNSPRRAPAGRGVKTAPLSFIPAEFHDGTIGRLCCRRQSRRDRHPVRARASKTGQNARTIIGRKPHYLDNGVNGVRQNPKNHPRSQTQKPPQKEDQKCMKCKYPFEARINGQPVIGRCGKCLPCAIRRRSCWELRVQLEARQSLSASFWTLTLDECSIMAASEACRVKTQQRFFDALRKSEARKGNPYPIRYFGCLEYGGQFGRPHWHLLLFNLQSAFIHPESYRPGYPRTKHHISQWPHGHIDVAEFNPATINYVCGYIIGSHDTKTEPSRKVATIQPAIGYYGVKRVALDHAKKHSIISAPLEYFEIGNRKYPMDKWTKNTFLSEYIRAGGIYRPAETARQRYTRVVIEDDIVAANMSPNDHRKALIDEHAFYEKAAQKAAAKQRRERTISARAVKAVQDDKPISALDDAILSDCLRTYDETGS